MSETKYNLDRKEMSSHYKRLILLFCVVGACGLSMVFTISFWTAMAATTLSACLLGATGAIFEVSKFYALPTFIEAKKQREWGRAAASAGMFIVLSFISMLAGIYALQHNLSLNAKMATVESTQYQMVMASVTAQEEKVKSMLVLAEQDTKAGYRQRAKETLNIVGKEQEVLNQLKFELLSHVEPRIEGVANLPFGSNTVSSIMVILLGALLEITTTFLICLFRSKPLLALKARKAGSIKKQIDNRVATSAVQQQTNSISKAELNDKYAKVVRSIKSKMLPPTQRAVKNAANVGSKTVTDFFIRMIDEGVLVKSQGNRYKLAQVA